MGWAGTRPLWDCKFSIKRGVMRLRYVRMAVFAVTAIVVSSMAWLNAQQRGGGASVAIDPDDIGGVVTSAKGPEAGVWVIAETTETPTRFARIVVTDDQGRYVVPDLPPATYQVFVRGYGLLDSPRQTAKRGQQLNLTATVAPDREVSGAGLSGRLVVCDASRARRRQGAGELPENDEGVLRLPSTGRQGDARISVVRAGRDQSRKMG